MGRKKTTHATRRTKSENKEKKRQKKEKVGVPFCQKTFWGGKRKRRKRRAKNGGTKGGKWGKKVLREGGVSKMRLPVDREEPTNPGGKRVRGIPTGKEAGGTDLYRKEKKGSAEKKEGGSERGGAARC